MPETKLKVYGLIALTRRKYIWIQLAGFVWLLALYGVWKYFGLAKSNIWMVSHLDVTLLVLYVYGLAETFVVLRKFKQRPKKSGVAQ